MNWPRLMRLGVGVIGLSPDAFWRLSPREFLNLIGADPDQDPPMSRAELMRLAELFPDLPASASNNQED
ncbi:MAG: phage tail assembly chaperone [Pseudomonadota bacterium]